MSAPTAAPSRAQQFGEALRGLREAAGVTLDSISTETKISRRILEGLEQGHFQFLPEQVFTRNFVRQYARAVGGDEVELLEWFDTAWEQFTVTSGSHPRIEEVSQPPRNPVRWRFWFPLALGVLLLVSAAVVIVRGTRLGQPAEPDPLRTLAGLPTPGTEPSVLSTPEATRVAEPTPAEEGELEEGALDLGVRVSGGKECWIRFRDREGRTEQRLLKTGEELKLELEEPVLLTLGNAAAVTVRVGQEEYRDLGRPGEVLHVEVTRQGITPLRSGVGHEQ